MISSCTIAPQDEMKMKSSNYLSSVGQLLTQTMPQPRAQTQCTKDALNSIPIDPDRYMETIYNTMAHGTGYRFAKW
jgi:hypothetical protein